MGSWRGARLEAEIRLADVDCSLGEWGIEDDLGDRGEE